MPVAIISTSAPTSCADEMIATGIVRSEEHTSELQSLTNLVCRLLHEKKKKKSKQSFNGVDMGEQRFIRLDDLLRMAYVDVFVIIITEFCIERRHDRYATLFAIYMIGL